MNCCGHNSNDPNKKGRKHHRGQLSHLWMMVLCCGAPFILLFIISLLGAGFPGIKAALLRVLPFICPLMMIGMLPMMFLHGKNHDDSHQEQQENTLPEDNRIKNKRLN